MKFRLKFNHGFVQFFFQNVRNEKYMKCTRAACGINSEISSRDKNTTLMYFVTIFTHYYDVIIEGL